jgi:uncharacterized membrane protein HdeD (DUF308 family)
MLQVLTRNWWLFVLQGFLAVAFGIAAYAWPGRTLAVLIPLFGVYVLIDGLLCLVRTFHAASLGVTWWPYLFQGLAGIGAGIATFAWPGLTALLLIYFIGSWALVGGVLQIVAGVMLSRVLTGEWRLILSGALSVLFGLWMMVAPGEGAVALLWVIATYTVLLGIALIAAGIQLRSVNARLAGSARVSQA